MSWAVWITGLPGSGKTVIARKVRRILEERDVSGSVKVLELDEIRRFITPHPTYSDEERELVYASLVYMAKLLDGMKPDEMTGLVAELDNKMILKVLPKMKPQNASKLLAQLPAKRAAAITTALLDSDS